MRLSHDSKDIAINAGLGALKGTGLGAAAGVATAVATGFAVGPIIILTAGSVAAAAGTGAVIGAVGNATYKGLKQWRLHRDFDRKFNIKSKPK